MVLKGEVLLDHLPATFRGPDHIEDIAPGLYAISIEDPVLPEGIDEENPRVRYEDPVITFIVEGDQVKAFFLNSGGIESTDIFVHGQYIEGTRNKADEEFLEGTEQDELPAMIIAENFIMHWYIFEETVTIKPENLSKVRIGILTEDDLMTFSLVDEGKVVLTFSMSFLT